MTRLISYLMLMFVVCCSAFLLDNDSLQNLLARIRQEKEARALLEGEIKALRSNVELAQARYQASKCSCPPSQVIAFSATLTGDVTNFGDNQPLIYNKVITNVGGNYDSRHGIFRAPVSGTYKFSFSVLQGTGTMWVAVELVRNGSPIGRVKVGDSSYWEIGTNIINVHLTAGDDVWVRHQGNQGQTNTIPARGGGFNLFTGHLVHSD